MTGRLGGPVADGVHGWWEFPATTLDVLDADTIRCRLDLGLRTTRVEPVRLVGVDAPEKNTAEGKAARAFVADLLPTGTAVTVFTRRPDKFGRVLGTIVTERGDLSTLLLDAGHARPYDGGPR